MKTALKKVLRVPHQFFLKRMEKERFNPGTLGLFVNPFYFARKGLYRELTPLSRQLSGKLLDVGCGSKPYRNLFSVTDYIGLEVDTPRNRAAGYADSFYDGKTFPFGNGDFDSVFASQVLEHIFEPDEFLSEIHRVLKPNGRLLLTVPFVWDEHEQPHDYARYSSFGLSHLLSKNGFKVIEARKSVTTVAVVFQMLNAYLYKKTATKSLYLNLIVTFLLIAPWNIIGTIAAWLLPKNLDLYLDNVVLAEKL